MADKKPGKDAALKKEPMVKSEKLKRGVRFLSVFTAADGSQLIFRNYPSREEIGVKADLSTDELGRLVKKAHSEIKAK